MPVIGRALNTHTDPVLSVSSGCTLFFYESDGRSGIDHNSVPKHAVWVENSIVQAVPEHPKKDFVFCLSNSLGDAFLFQVCGALSWHREPSCLAQVPCPPLYNAGEIFFTLETKVISDKINTGNELQK